MKVTYPDANHGAGIFTYITGPKNGGGKCRCQYSTHGAFGTTVCNRFSESS